MRSEGAMKRLVVLAVCLGPVWASCGCDSQTPAIESAEQAIIGGTYETGYPAVGVMLSNGGAMCTGTLITKKIVLTAGHCVDPYDPPKWFYLGSSIESPTNQYSVKTTIRHPDYGQAWDGTLNHDIGLLVLSSEAAAAPMAYRTGSISGFEGKSITFVGFGLTSAYDQYSSGTKMKVTVTIDDITSSGFWNYTNSSNPKNTCSGDSGGPGFVTTEGVQEVVGVVSSGDQYCKENGFNTRVDIHADWILENIELYDSGSIGPGTCGNGVCEASESSTTCPGDCGGDPTGDLWSSCSSGGDCESGLCLQTGEGNFCSKYCGTPETGAGCPSGFVCVGLQDPPPNGDGVCYSTGQSASSCGNGSCDAGEYYEICSADCIVSGCGEIESVGCCQSNVLKWCEQGSIYMVNCTGTKCGWDSQNGYYNCDTTGASDPSGQNPISCSGGQTSYCGDGTCDGNETASNCATDCKVTDPCGNGVCDNGENYQSCSKDCTKPSCGNIRDVGCCTGNVMQWCDNGQVKMMDCSLKLQCGWDASGGYYDCSETVLEDPSGKNPRNCDAPVAAECGDGKCEVPESTSTCPQDCVIGWEPVCGDGKCQAPESTQSCPADCVVGYQPVCGDGKCEAPESTSSCADDCVVEQPAVCGNGECEAGESASSCKADCDNSVASACGDGKCGDDETCDNCEKDCGECWIDELAKGSGCSSSGSGGPTGLVLLLSVVTALGFIRRFRVRTAL